MARVLVLGGGFGGLAGAHELRRVLDDGDEIVLVARDDAFYMGFAKLWDLAGTRPLADGTASLHGLAARGVRYVQADVTGIDPEARAVESTDGTLEADAILVALGATDHRRHVEQLRGAAHNLYDGAALPAMRAALERLDRGRVVVTILGGPIRCPPAPFEGALIVDDVLRRRGVRDAVEIVMATPQPTALPVAGVDASSYVAAALGDRDVLLLAEHAVERVDGDAGVVRYTNGTEVGFDVLFGVPASVPPPVVRDSPLAGQSGWIEPDPQTLATAFARVYAVGDCTQIATATGQLPKAGVFAANEAVVAARNIAADLGVGQAATFDGHGACYLEFPGEEVAIVEGNFYARPEPDVALTPPSRAGFEAKVAYERDRLTTWLA